MQNLEPLETPGTKSTQISKTPFGRDHYSGDILALSRRIGKLKTLINECRTRHGRVTFDDVGNQALEAVKLAQHMFLLLSFGAVIKDRDKQDENELEIKRLYRKLLETEQSANAAFSRALFMEGRTRRV